ncbi:MAG: Hsp20/alpha crystallin family protein [Planctomycetota bacterium]
MLMRRSGTPMNHDLMNMMMADPFGFAREARPAALPIDVLEKDGAIVVQASVPGYTKGEVSVTLDKRVLTIRAEHEATNVDATNDDQPRYYFRERHHAALERSVRLPGDVEGSAVTAELEHGVLTLTIPRTEASQPRAIEIN